MITLVLGPSVNAAVVFEPPSAVEMSLAIPMASELPSASTRISRGLWRSSPAFVSADHITPLDMITRRLEMSHRCGSASRARSIGFANASPTMEMLLTRSRSMVSSSSAGL